MVWYSYIATWGIMMDIKEYKSSNENVTKIVFTLDDAVYESVLYKYGSYEERTVLCVSIQSGCAVGCKFCGTGNKLIRNLSWEEIVNQVFTSMNIVKTDSRNIKKLQIMFMSMGEPFHNYENLKLAIKRLNELYPNAQLLVSTIAPNKKYEMYDFIELCLAIDKIGLQFSIHKSNDTDRNYLIPYKNKLNLAEIRDYGLHWFIETGRKPYINYCVDGNNCSDSDYLNLRNLFPPNVFNVTLSVVCSADETMKDSGFRNLEIIQEFESKFLKDGYNTRIFDPAGQDDIGGGCGQLWYVQEWINKSK